MRHKFAECFLALTFTTVGFKAFAQSGATLDDNPVLTSGLDQYYGNLLEQSQSSKGGLLTKKEISELLKPFRAHLERLKNAGSSTTIGDMKTLEQLESYPGSLEASLAALLTIWEISQRVGIAAHSKTHDMTEAKRNYFKTEDKILSVSREKILLHVIYLSVSSDYYNASINYPGGRDKFLKDLVDLK